MRAIDEPCFVALAHPARLPLEFLLAAVCLAQFSAVVRPRVLAVKTALNCLHISPRQPCLATTASGLQTRCGPPHASWYHLTTSCLRLALGQDHCGRSNVALKEHAGIGPLWAHLQSNVVDSPVCGVAHPSPACWICQVVKESRNLIVSCSIVSRQTCGGGSERVMVRTELQHAHTRSPKFHLRHGCSHSCVLEYGRSKWRVRAFACGVHQ